MSGKKGPDWQPRSEAARSLDPDSWQDRKLDLPDGYEVELDDGTVLTKEALEEAEKILDGDGDEENPPAVSEGAVPPEA